MTIDHLHLLNFKNYAEAEVSFSPKLNVLVGKNGSGKTNLLDAIYFLSLCKSSIHSQDALSIKFDADFAQIEGRFGKELITCSMQRGGKKSFFYDKVSYEKIIPIYFGNTLLGKKQLDLVIGDQIIVELKAVKGLLPQVFHQQIIAYLKAAQYPIGLLVNFGNNRCTVKRFLNDAA